MVLAFENVSLLELVDDQRLWDFLFLKGFVSLNVMVSQYLVVICNNVKSFDTKSELPGLGGFALIISDIAVSNGSVN